MGWQTATSVSDEPAISIQPSEQKKEDGGTTLFQNTGNKAPDYTVSFIPKNSNINLTHPPYKKITQRMFLQINENSVSCTALYRI